MPEVAVPAERVVRWVENFERRHGTTVLTVREGALEGAAEDGSRFVARLPFGQAYDAGPDAHELAAVAERLPGDWGVLLVRKGGFAVARLRGRELTDHKVGQRHVQGRTKAGGQSQLRFARRRDKQAREAYQAASDHAARILVGLAGPLVIGGDRGAAEEVLADPRLSGLTVTGPWLPVGDPKRAVLDRAVEEAAAVRMAVVNADAP